MSYDMDDGMYDDYGYDDYGYEDYEEQLYAEHRGQAIAEFTAERLQSFYLAHRLLAEPPLRSLLEARRLLAAYPSASLVFAASAMEVGVKVVLLKPIVYGLIHAESVAALVAELTIGHTGVDRFRDLLFQILSEHGGVDLRGFRREGSSRTLWDEMSEVQKRRNAVLHRAEAASEEEAARAIAVASAVLETLFPAVVTNLGLHLHDGVRVCNEWRCKREEILRSEEG